MTLKYRIIQNPLKPDTGHYIALPTDNKTMNAEDIIEHMISRGSTITKAEALATIEEFNRSLCEIIKNGNNVSTEVFSAYHSIKGVFANPQEMFNSNKHAHKLNMRAGKRLVEACQNIEYSKIEKALINPTIKFITNLKSGETNKTVNIGQLVSLTGTSMKIIEEKPECGLFLIDSNKNEIKIDQLVRNRPSEIMFYIPESINPGKHNVELRTYLNRNKKLFTERFKYAIEVALL
jgi:hypothetical protein